uniref:Uncharacterized protein n=1 Tax=Agrotis segetum granulosis virus TaxID=10464 RepID=A0A023MII5_GVAS|nr:hypothetical protein AsGV015 [Agrotis segetum granulovirus]
MKYFAIEGLAATTKTTILKQLEGKFCVHLTDYKEIREQLQLTESKVLSEFVYLLYRLCDEVKTGSGRHIFDRQPVAAILYQLIHLNAPDSVVFRYARLIKYNNWNKNWFSLIILTKEGQEENVVETMVERDNGIDWAAKEYVLRQNRVFKIWADVMEYPVYYFDYKKDFNKQQKEIILIVKNLMNDYFPLPWYKKIINTFTKNVTGKRVFL